MSSFKSINTRKYIYKRPEKGIDFPYWKQLSQPVVIKENSVIDFTDVSPAPPHNFAVTCSVRVQIYNPVTKDLAMTLSRFQKTAYGGNFGKNGQLLVTGDEEGVVQIFETNTKRSLRTFRGHTKGVHRAYFTADKLHIASFSDDYSIRLWDIAGDKCVQTYTEHSDYVRAGCVSPVSTDILLSGGYDNKVKMYDTRTKSVVFEVDHGAPVNSLLFLPTGGIFISSGGSHVNVWDAFSGGRLLARMNQHSKDVTCLRLASNGRRLLSGGLDRKVKIYDTATYQNVHTLDFPNGVTSMGVAPNDETLIVGMIDGIVSIQRMDSDRQITNLEKKKVPRNVLSSTDELVEDYRKVVQAKYTDQLRKFEYVGALTTVFTNYAISKTPHITVGLIAELIRRRGLGRALVGQKNPDNFLIKFISFLIRYLGDRRFTRTLIDATNILLDTYEDFSLLKSDVAKKMCDLSSALKREEHLIYDCLQLEGAFQMLFAGAKVAEQSEDLIEYGHELNNLKPSDEAGKQFIVEVE